MKTFTHPQEFMDQFKIGDIYYNKTRKVSAKIIKIERCGHKEGHFCSDCRSEGKVLCVKRLDAGVDDGEVVSRWCHSIWENW